jgi:hypothetical protein
MAKIFDRTKLALILTAPIFLMMIWILALSSTPLIQSFGLVGLIAWAAIASLISAYAITIFVVEVSANPTN